MESPRLLQNLRLDLDTTQLFAAHRICGKLRKRHLVARMNIVHVPEARRERIHEDRALLRANPALDIAVLLPGTVHLRKAHHHKGNVPACAQFVDYGAERLLLIRPRGRDVRADARGGIGFALIPQNPRHGESPSCDLADPLVVHLHRPRAVI